MTKKLKKVLSTIIVVFVLLSVMSVGVSSMFSGLQSKIAENVFDEMHCTEIEHISDDCNSENIILNNGEIVLNGLGKLPVSEEAYCYRCNICKEKLARTTPRDLQSDGTYGNCIKSGCSGKYIGYTMCALEYYYAFECSTCGRKDDFDELPAATSSAPYGTCLACGTAATEDMFKISFRFMQYSKLCFYCFEVQYGTKEVLEIKACPKCGEVYDWTEPDSVDSNGNLIYGGGGDNLYYCKQTQKFYEAIEDEDDNVNVTCPYCGEHQTYKVNVLYCVECPSCGTRAERAHLDHLKRPYVLATLNNIFITIGQEISGDFDPSAYELSNTCYNCKHNFSADNNITITRHVDAPDGTVYEVHSNDRNYHETDTYIEKGSEYDNFFERIIWFIKNLFWKIFNS